MTINRRDMDSGFGLVELVIAVFILGLIAITMLPALFNGIAYSHAQASTATATRFLYSVVEQGREDALTVGSASTWCSHRTTAVASTPGPFTAAVASCTAGSDSLVTLTLTATSIGSTPTQLATVTAKVYVP